MRDDVLNVDGEGVLSCIDELCNLSDNVKSVKGRIKVDKDETHPNF